MSLRSNRETSTWSAVNFTKTCDLDCKLEPAIWSCDTGQQIPYFDRCQLIILWISAIYELTNKEASTVLCSVVKHAGSGRARKKCRGKHETKSSVFPHFLSALPLPKCFTTEQSTVEASLFVL